MKLSKNLRSPFSLLGLPAAEAFAALRSSSAVVGFDGFLDTITKVIKKTGTDTIKPEYFDTLSSFGKYLAGHDQMNCSLELETRCERFGGNAPLLANALGQLGVNVECYGTFGTPHLHPAFQNLNCNLHSFGNVSQSLALEFRDGKVFLGTNTVIPRPAWDHIASCLDQRQFCQHLQQAKLIALVNWSELDYSHDLWEEIYRECLSRLEMDKTCYAFFDLCDISRKSDTQVLQVMDLIKEYSQKRYTVLSLNKNEAMRVGACIGAEQDVLSICKILLERCALNEVIVHTRQKNYLVLSDGTVYCCDITSVENPVVLTGAGDHFNAAYCASLLMNAPSEGRLQFASEFASSYVGTGRIPTWEEEI